MDINFELYKVFYYVALEKQISAAAKRLFISQPAVSQSIKQLEKKIDGDLFFRTPRGMSLTKEGEVLFDYVEKAFGLIKIGESKYNQLKDLNQGELMIGASDTLCSHYLMPFFQQYNKAHPNIKLKITNGTSSKTVNLIRKGQVELGIVNLPLKDTRGLEVIPLKEIQDCFIISTDFKNTCHQLNIFQDIIKQPIIALEKTSNSRRYVDEYFDSKGLLFSPEIELGSLELIFKFVKIGLGIGCVSREFIDQSLLDQDIHIVETEDTIPKRHIGLVYIKNIALSSASQRFVELLQNPPKEL